MNRIEYKILIKKSKKINFLNYLTKIGFKKMYNPRIVNSLYFENKFNEIYSDSVEGIQPRKKIRLRYYGTNKILKSEDIQFNLEIKYTLASGRSKKTTAIDRNKFYKYIKYGYFDRKYGVSNPNIWVKYKRSYFLSKDFRITFDEDISFKKIAVGSNNKAISKKINEIVVELKSENVKKLDYLKKLFPFKETRFSKYCKGVEALKLIQ